MEETMNSGAEVTTEEAERIEQAFVDVIEEDPSGGPSKTFVGLVVGGIAAVAIGAAVAWKRHKKNKMNNVRNSGEDFYYEDFEDDSEDTEVIEEAAPKTVEEPTEKKTGKK